MKKYIIAAICFLGFGTHSMACDICGCGVGNFNPHMFPHLSKNFINVGYQYRHFKTHLHDGSGEENKEYYRSIQLTGQFSPFRKVQLMASIPFQMNKQDGVHGVKTLNQLGDAVILGNYRLLDNYSGKEKLVRHTIVAGMGVKLPTGKFEYDHNNDEQVHNANFQAGSGSTDLLLNGSYNLRYSRWVFTTGATYKLNGPNRESYRFGDRFLGIIQSKYIIDLGRYSLIPNLGINYEKLEMDKKLGVVIDHTGGFNIQGTTGVDINNRNWAAGFMYQRSIYQNLAEGHIHSMPGFNLHLSYSF